MSSTTAVAIVTAGVTASWGGTTFGRVLELRSTFGGSLPANRGGSTSLSAAVSVAGGISTQSTTYTLLNTPWSLDAGTIDVLCLSTANILLSEYGRKRVLAMGGTVFIGTSTVNTAAVLFTTKAVCQTISANAKVNDVWRFQNTFKIVKESN
jgi:hypothetical protein